MNSVLKLADAMRSHHFIDSILESFDCVPPALVPGLAEGRKGGEGALEVKKERRKSAKEGSKDGRKEKGQRRS